tara:strand:+ start:645 stop:917 length:273 start_codon:yes stop_codon:yes gene_type:complete
MELKKPPAGKKGKGLRKLPKDVRNKMGFLKEGGKVMPGMKKRMKKKKRVKAMGGGVMKKRMKAGGMAKKKRTKKKKRVMKRGGGMTKKVM